MKKIIVVVIILAMITVFLIGCEKNKNENLIRLNEVTHSVFYAPLYVAINEGFLPKRAWKLN